VSPVKYELGFYIPEDGILHSHCRENLKSYTFLAVVLYGSKTWSLTLREEYRGRVFDNSVLRKTFGPKRDKGTGGLDKAA
jgi:hypothetical protein